MSAQLLRDRLQKQLEKKQGKKPKVIKISKKKKVLPNIGQIKRKTEEEQNIRDLLMLYRSEDIEDELALIEFEKDIIQSLKEKYPNEKDYANKLIKRWKKLDKHEKILYILKARRDNFLIDSLHKYLSMYSPDQIHEFIETYLDRPVPILDYIQRMKDRFQEKLIFSSEQDMKEDDETYKGVKYESVEKMVNDINQGNREFYENLAVALNIGNVKQRSPADLALTIYENKNFLEKRKANLSEELNRISQKELYRRAKKLGISDAKNIHSDILKVLLLQPEKVSSKQSLIEQITSLTNVDAPEYESYTVNELENIRKDIYEAGLEDVEEEKVEKKEKYDMNCIKRLAQYGWINGTVSGLWISPLDKSLLNIYASPENISYKCSTLTKPPKKWFSANKNFMKLYCGVNSINNEQSGNVLTCYDMNMQKIQFYVAFTVMENLPNTIPITCSGPYKGQYLLLQNEKIFQDEKKYRRKEHDLLTDKINTLLSQPIDNKCIETAKLSLCKALQSISNNKIDYGIENCNTPYINIAVNSILKENQTVRDFFRIIARTIVYINIPQAESFHHKIKEEYYLPDMLLKLPEIELFPEVYDNPLYKAIDISNTEAKIQLMIESMVNRLAHATINRTDPTSKRRLYEEEKIESLDIIVNCVNKDVLKHTEPENIGYYIDPETEEVFCLDMQDIAKNISMGNYTNPYSGKKFSKEFLRQYMIVYIDTEDGKKYTFPLVKLQKRFSNNNFINPQSGKLFENEFVQKIIQGQHEIDLDKFDYRLKRCVNFETLKDEDITPTTTIFYKDEKDNNTYCFKLDSILEWILTSPKKVMNPFTGRTFRKDFISAIQRKYSLLLSKGGLLQKYFQDVYGDKDIKTISTKIKIIEGKEGKDIVYDEKSEKYIYKEKEPLDTLPNIWNDLLVSLEPYEKKEEAEIRERLEEQLSEDEDISETLTGDVSDASDISSEIESELSDDFDEESVEMNFPEKKELEVKEGNTEIAKELETVEKPQTRKCSHCGKEHSELYKTIKFSPDGKHEVYYFCSTKCFENVAPFKHGVKNRKKRNRKV